MSSLNPRKTLTSLREGPENELRERGRRWIATFPALQQLSPLLRHLDVVDSKPKLSEESFCASSAISAGQIGMHFLHRFSESYRHELCIVLSA